MRNRLLTLAALSLLALAIPASVTAEPEFSTYLLRSQVIGDADGDGRLTYEDAKILMSYAPRKTGDLDCDFNGDGTADISDAIAILRHLSEGGKNDQRDYVFVILGDVNQDGKVDINDTAALGAHLFGGRNLPGHVLAADLNRDGKVDLADWDKLVRG